MLIINNELAILIKVDNITIIIIKLEIMKLMTVFKTAIIKIYT